MKQRSDLLQPGLVVSLSSLNSPDPRQRDLAADQLSDFSRRLGNVLAPAIAGAVVVAFLAETDHDAAESQLFVLSDICLFHFVPESVTQPVTDRLENGTCEDWEVEYIEAIVDVINSRAEPDPSDQQK